MLTSVNVKNLALIREADIEFEKGLNILTGETGAGKSIVIGSINIALGGKVSKDIVREGAPYGYVELVFEISDDKLKEKLSDLDVFMEDNTVIISRKITNGRSQIKVNGETKTATELKAITSLLIDVHGQHDHQSLLEESKHILILDKYGYESLSDELNEVKRAYEDYKGTQSMLAEYGDDEEERQRQISFAKFEVEEIENANLQKKEDIELEEEYRVLTNANQIITSVGTAYQMLEGMSDGSVSDMLGGSVKELSKVASIDGKLSDFSDRLAELESLVRDMAVELNDYIDSMDYSEERLYEVGQRLDAINHLKQKYGNSVEEILSYKQARSEYLYKMENFTAKKEEILRAVEEKENILKQKCEALSVKRKKVASELEKNIVEVLKDLNFLDVSFKVEFDNNDKPAENGYDNVRFLISTNPGETLRPLAKIASGGELSRIMLGLKTIMAKQDEIDTLIFDEIDTGISGKTASLVAEKMNLISNHHQVICITHLPQIAAMSDHHYLIEKSVENNETITRINRLNEEQSVDEIVRILGGGQNLDTAYSHAVEMKKMALKTKKSQCTNN